MGGSRTPARTEQPNSRIPRPGTCAAIDFQSDLGQKLRDFCFGLHLAAEKPHHGDQVYSRGIPFDAAAVLKG